MKWTSDQEIYFLHRNHLFLQFLVLRRFCSDDSDFSEKSENLVKIFRNINSMEIG